MQQSQKVLWVAFEFTVLQRNLKEWHEKPWTDVCECERKATKVGSTATLSGTVYWSYPLLPFGIVACTFLLTTFLEIAVYIFNLANRGQTCLMSEQLLHHIARYCVNNFLTHK